MVLPFSRAPSASPCNTTRIPRDAWLDRSAAGCARWSREPGSVHPVQSAENCRNVIERTTPNPPFAVEALEESDHQQPRMPARSQRGLAEFLVIKAPTALLTDAIEAPADPALHLRTYKQDVPALPATHCGTSRSCRSRCLGVRIAMPDSYAETFLAGNYLARSVDFVHVFPGPDTRHLTQSEANGRFLATCIEYYSPHSMAIELTKRSIARSSMQHRVASAATSARSYDDPQHL